MLTLTCVCRAEGSHTPPWRGLLRRGAAGPTAGRPGRRSSQQFREGKDQNLESTLKSMSGSVSLRRHLYRTVLGQGWAGHGPPHLWSSKLVMARFQFSLPVGVQGEWADGLLAGQPASQQASQPASRSLEHHLSKQRPMSFLAGCVAAWLRGCVAAWLRGCVAAWLRGCLAAKLRSCEAAKLRSCEAAWLQG